MKTTYDTPVLSENERLVASSQITFVGQIYLKDNPQSRPIEEKI